MSRLTTSLATSAVLASALALPSCSFTRFSDLEEDTPVVLLDKPKGLTSFGVSLSVARRESQTHLLVGGAAGVATAGTFSVGDGESPKLDALDTGFCDEGTDRGCFLATSTAGLGQARSPDSQDNEGLRDLCFAAGIGYTPFGQGLILRCADDSEFPLGVPQTALDSFVKPALEDDEPAHVALATDANERPALLVGAPAVKLAWVYPPLGLDPIELISEASDPSYGQQVAVLRAGAEYVFAVAAPERAHVWFFRTEGGVVSADTVRAAGCFSGEPGFGQTLTAGRIDSDDRDELVVTDSTGVKVFDGAALASLPLSSGPCAAPPPGALRLTVACADSNGTSGCARPGFGTALAIGDLDGDGDGELIVGAPQMTARGESGAGAVLVYDADGTDAALSQTHVLGSADANDRLGSALAAPWIGDRHIVAAGAPGGNKVALFYCSQLPGAKSGARCR